jgi:hypothetical protein
MSWRCYPGAAQRHTGLYGCRLAFWSRSRLISDWFVGWTTPTLDLGPKIQVQFENVGLDGPLTGTPDISRTLFQQFRL